MDTKTPASPTLLSRILEKFLFSYLRQRAVSAVEGVAAAQCSTASNQPGAAGSSPVLSHLPQLTRPSVHQTASQSRVRYTCFVDTTWLRGSSGEPLWKKHHLFFFEGEESWQSGLGFSLLVSFPKTWWERGGLKWIITGVIYAVSGCKVCLFFLLVTAVVLRFKLKRCYFRGFRWDGADILSVNKHILSGKNINITFSTENVMRCVWFQGSGFLAHVLPDGLLLRSLKMNGQSKQKRTFSRRAETPKTL